MTKHLQITDVKVSALKPNTWNTNVVTPENEEKIKQSLTRFGFFRPVIARELDDGSYQIIGGQHRWAVAKELGYETVPVINLGNIDDKKAKEIGLVDNGRYGTDDTLLLADLLQEIGVDTDLESFLPYTNQELENIFAASNISLDDLDLDDDDELPPLSETVSKAVQSHQIMRFKIPVEDAEMVQGAIEAVMRTQGFQGDDSLTNAGNALVHILKGIK